MSRMPLPEPFTSQRPAQPWAPRLDEVAQRRLVVDAEQARGAPHRQRFLLTVLPGSLRRCGFASGHQPFE